LATPFCSGAGAATGAGAAGAGATFVMVVVLLLLTIMDLDIAEVSLVFGSLLSRLMRSELAVRLGSALEAEAALGTGGSCGFVIYLISFLGYLWD